MPRSGAPKLGLIGSFDCAANPFGLARFRQRLFRHALPILVMLCPLLIGLAASPRKAANGLFAICSMTWVPRRFAPALIPETRLRGDCLIGLASCAKASIRLSCTVAPPLTTTTDSRALTILDPSPVALARRPFGAANFVRYAVVR